MVESLQETRHARCWGWRSTRSTIEGRPDSASRRRHRRASARGRAPRRARSSCGSPSDRGRAGVGIEDGAHRTVSVVESRPDRAGRDRQRIGDLRHLQSGEVAQHEDGALLGWQAAEAAIQLVSVGDADVVVRGFGEVKRKDPDRGSRRRSRFASETQDRTRRRRSHASKRSGSRSAGRSRQAITNASCTASSVRSTSRRIRCAIANRRSARTRIRSAYASRSPPRAASTRSRSTCIVPGRRSAGRRSDHIGVRCGDRVQSSSDPPLPRRHPTWTIHRASLATASRRCSMRSGSTRHGAGTSRARSPRRWAPVRA